jgi:hypothetical protein
LSKDCGLTIAPNDCPTGYAMSTNDYLATILREQNLTSAELDALRRVREQIEAQLSVLEGSPRFYYGGSFGKKTMVRARYDLDLVMFWPPTATYSIDGIYKAVGDILKKHWQSVNSKTVAWQLPFQGGFHIDVVPGRALDAHVIEFHVVTKGFCWGGLVDEQPIRLQVGDIIIFPQGDAHVLSSEPGMRTRPDITLYQGSERTQLPFALTLGDTGPPTAHVVCGFLGCDSRPFNPLLGALPRMLHLREGANLETGWLAHFIRAAIEESENKRPGVL